MMNPLSWDSFLANVLCDVVQDSCIRALVAVGLKLCFGASVIRVLLSVCL